MAQAVSRRSLKAKALGSVPGQSMCSFRGGGSGTGTSFSSELFGFILSISLHSDSPYSGLGDEQRAGCWAQFGNSFNPST
jgi:hypothetical protein